MAQKANSGTSPRVGDDVALDKTGKTWMEWFALLDEAGALQMTHKEIVAIVNDHSQTGPWWAQMVTVVYEQERGLRDRHQKPGGYEISRSRTVAAPAIDLYMRLSDEKYLADWLGEKGITLRKMTPYRTMRLNWGEGATIVEIRLVEKGESTGVTVQHMKLPNAESAEKMKDYWEEKLEVLKSLWAEASPSAASVTAVPARSGKTVAQKLMIRKGSFVRFVDPPQNYESLLGPLPEGVTVVSDGAQLVDTLQLFVTSRAALERKLPEVKSLIAFTGSIWITYPKGTSKMKSDINRDTIAAYAMTIGLEGVAIISVNEEWSALRVLFA